MQPKGFKKLTKKCSQEVWSFWCLPSLKSAIRNPESEFGLAAAFADLPALPTGRQAAGRRGRPGWFSGRCGFPKGGT